MNHRTENKFKRHVLAAAISSSLALSQFAFAQNSQAPRVVEEEVIVTGVISQSSPIEASVSISSLKSEDVFKAAPRSVAEVFRGLPGIRAESSGGNGNANITIRGIPLATGGSKYMQIHEDGLPVLEYGDINFANADNFIRYDWSIDRVESVRGGSASTFASNSPGGIINLISNYGKEEGGSVGMSFGVDYDEFRTDFETGGSITDTMYYHIGGFFRNGEGVRETDFSGDSGGQIKLNVTKEFDNGYLRFFAKQLDDKVTTYLPSPVLVEGNGSFGALPGYDASSQTLHSPATDQIVSYGPYGNPRGRAVSDGIESKVSAFGFEAEFDVADGWSFTNKFRNSSVSGGFISPFTDGFAGGTASIGAKATSLCADASGSVASGVVNDPATDADESRIFGRLQCDDVVASVAGEELSGADLDQLAYTNLTFDTTFEDVGLLVNDFKITRSFSNVDVTFGYYYSNQDIDISWNSWHARIQTVSGSNSQNVDIVARGGAVDADGNPVDVVLADNGAVSQSFLSWDWDLNYVTTAPYINVGIDATDALSFDLSVRQDDVQARGWRLDGCCGGNRGADLNGNGEIGSYTIDTAGAAPGGDGVLIVSGPDVLLEDPTATSAGFIAGGVRALNENNGTNVQRVNYDADNTSYSLGGTFLLNDDSSVFARYSDGGRAIADRLTQVAGSLNADGSLTSSTDGYDNVTQLEVGYKLDTGDLRFYATLFDTDVEETNADITTGETFVRDYTATGIELESRWNITDIFLINGNLTWSDAEIASDANNASVVGNTPRRQADFIYTITPELNFNQFSTGLTFQGSTDYDVQDSNELQQDGYTLLHAFAKWIPTEEISISLAINNLTDEFVITEAEEGSATAGSIIRARPLSARSTSLSFRYMF